MTGLDSAGLFLTLIMSENIFIKQKNSGDVAHAEEAEPKARRALCTWTGVRVIR